MTELAFTFGLALLVSTGWVVHRKLFPKPKRRKPRRRIKKAA